MTESSSVETQPFTPPDTLSSAEKAAVTDANVQLGRQVDTAAQATASGLMDRRGLFTKIGGAFIALRLKRALSSQNTSAQTAPQNGNTTK